jgi:type I restriction enzyme S subunit
MRTLVERLAKSTSGVNNINSTQIQRLPISHPDIDEQHEIVRLIEKAFAWINRLASETTSARKLIDYLDQAVLAKAFRGELVPQDPNDEPAICF